MMNAFMTAKRNPTTPFEVRFAMRKSILAALLCILVSAPLAHAEGGAAAPAMSAAPAAAAAPAVIGTTGPTALSPLAPAAAGTAATTAPPTGLPAVISDKGASPLPLGEMAPPPAPGKDGAPAKNVSS